MWVSPVTCLRQIRTLSRLPVAECLIDLNAAGGIFAGTRENAVMVDAASLISAIAASIAAALIALNLAITGRREQAKWARDTLIELFSSFVNLSFKSKDVVKQAIRQSSHESWPPASDAAVRAEARHTERQMCRRRLKTDPGASAEF
jgi:hypothetical protein